MISKKFILGGSLLLLTLLRPLSLVSAHVVVQPNQAGIGSWHTFIIGVPNEKNVPTTDIRIVIPEGLSGVSPNVKPGWTINITKTSEGEKTNVSQIEWKAGSIPEGQRDEFLFHAQVPSKESTLQWKVYQTYQDGTVVSWDEAPATDEKDDDSGSTGPYSETKVFNDLISPAITPASQNGNPQGNIALILSIFSIVVAVFAFRKINNISV